MSEVRTLLFVYGTLKRGHCRDYALRTQQFITEAQTLPEFRMFNLGTYPGIIRAAESGVSIRGEIWSVSQECLKQIDDIEGTDEGLYERIEIDLLDSDLAVETYLCLTSVDGCPDCGTTWMGE